MLFSRILWILVVLLTFLTNSYAIPADADEIYRNFWHPEYHGQRLDYCAPKGKACGRAIANPWCKLMGYDYASQVIMAPNVGLTRYFGSTEKCTGWRCMGFMLIGCSRHISHNPPKSYHYREKSFVYPRMNHYRIDWCLTPQKGCGSKAANSFCKRMGYMKATHFVQDTTIAATKTVGNQALCFGKLCRGFTEIVCYR